MPATATTLDHLPGPGIGPDDGAARDWPEAWDAELAGWDEEDPEPESRAAGGREVFKAGRWDRTPGDGGGFAAGGVADHAAPGPALAGFAAAAWATGLSRLSEDELIGVMRAARRLTSWAAAMELAAIGDLWRRRIAEEDAGEAGAACHAGDEIAAALTLTGRAADRALDLALALRRLPLTSQALAAGDIDLPRAAVIAGEATGLGDAHAAAVDEAVAAAAPGQTTGQLRAAARRAVIAADPAAARRRKERAQQDARVERWDEHAGTAALAGRDLPPAPVLAADQNLTALARQLKAAGAPGTMDALRAQVFLALLTGTPVGSLLPGDPAAPHVSANTAGAGGAASRNGAAAGFLSDLARPSSADDPAPPGLPGLSGAHSQPADSTGTVNQFPGLGGTVGQFPGLRGSVNLTMPLATWLGQSDAPGHVGGHGPLDAGDSRDLARTLAARAGNPWCLTFADALGRPVAHGCARAGPAAGLRHPERTARPADEAGTDARAGPRAELRRDTRTGPRAGRPPPPRSQAATRPRSGAGNAADRWTFTITLLPDGSCDHAWQTAAYQPSAALRHLVEMRHETCVFPGCRRPARHCDKDHTVPYDQGGRTCLCNLAPLCRRHHQAKQATGWQLGQPEPGVLEWRLPHGRSYRLDPGGTACTGASSECGQHSDCDADQQ